MGRLFGTDGVRGVANDDLSPLLAFRLGRAAGALVASGASPLGRRGSGRPVVVVGCDTRVSGGMLEGAIAAGFASSGVDVRRAGILPTPALSYLTEASGADLGVMISASHNPVEDNGIKLFGPDGYKLADELELELEAMVAALEREDGLPRPTGTAVGRVREDRTLVGRYEAFLAERGPDLSGLKLVVDCANGAAYDVAPRLLRRLGAEVVAIHTGSGGEDINVGCGSTHPETLARAVREHRAAVGLALDGDADRCIAVDEEGQVVDGDAILAICALPRLRAGTLPGRAVAATVYSNGGLQAAMAREGGGVVVTQPGDRQVLAAMLAHGLVLGGEPSGHVIFLEHARTGDGLLTGLMLLAALRASGQPLSQLRRQLPRLPQRLLNVRVARREGLLERPEVAEAVEQARRALGSSGRVLVRPSGTESVVRVMVEGTDEGAVAAWAERIADSLRRAAGEGV